MHKIVREIDQLLRGEFTLAQDLRAGRMPVTMNTLVIAAGSLGAIYGVAMGLFAALGDRPAGNLQLVASFCKVPLLFLLTLVVTFPSLYVFSALANSRLQLNQTLRLLVAAITVNLTVLASFAPITAFFTLSTDSYPFMKLLNVFFFFISGLVGLGFLHRAVTVVFAPPSPAEAAARAEASPAAAPGAVAGPDPHDGFEPPATGRARHVFNIWVLIYCVVGAQMGWILRPFIGSPDAPFEWFRDRGSNFFIELVKTIFQFLGF